MDGIPTYAACGVLIALYAWGRFNTPPSNRSSTRQTLYWSSALGYVLSALALFVALVILLKAGPWRKFLIPGADDGSLPVPLIATLAMTTLLPSLPYLKRLDEALLALFLDWAEIPDEVKRRAATLTPESFAVSREDVAALRAAYGDGSWGESLIQHLRRHGGEKLELSQHRFTCVVKLHHALHKLARERRYTHFFDEAGREWAELDQKTGEFLRRSAASLTLAARLRAVENEDVYEELAKERREQFARSCREHFVALALFLAHAVLRSEGSEKDILRRLRETGFAAAEPMNLPGFPINSLTGLALGVFLYLVLAIPFFAVAMGMSQQQTGGLLTAAKVTVVRLATVALTVWLLQRYSFFRRGPGEPPRFFAYAVNGAICAAAAAGICLVFHLTDADPLAGARGDLPLILLTFLLCTAVAACCEDRVGDEPPPFWWRPAEGLACALAMAAGMGIVVTYMQDLLPFPVAALPARNLALLIAMPSVLALVLGACVPHIYRSARRAASARRDEARAAERELALPEAEPEPPPP
ncbi:MAG TPA: hypothetical protein VGF60_20405, partial [Xanthobacteraceae bacterium]